MLIVQIVNMVNLTTLVASPSISQIRLTFNYFPVNAVPHVVVASTVYTDIGLNLTGTTLVDFNSATMAAIEFVDRTVVRVFGCALS